MKLKPEVSSLEGVPEALHEFYEEKEGKFVLAVEGGFVSDARFREVNTKLAEFRDNNRDLHSKLTAMQEQFEGAVDARFNELKSTYDQRFAALEEQRHETERELSERTLTDELTKVAIAEGVKPEALPDVVERGRKVFQIKEGKIAAIEGDTPLSEWMRNLFHDAAHLFKPSYGGGAERSRSAATSLHRPGPEEFGRRLEDIATGKVSVDF